MALPRPLVLGPRPLGAGSAPARFGGLDAMAAAVTWAIVMRSRCRSGRQPEMRRRRWCAVSFQMRCSSRSIPPSGGAAVRSGGRHSDGLGQFWGEFEGAWQAYCVPLKSALTIYRNCRLTTPLYLHP